VRTHDREDAPKASPNCHDRLSAVAGTDLEQCGDL